ncbi:hypothetical protein BH10ACI1_BH10ACI1_10400 [soil metagenome]
MKISRWIWLPLNCAISYAALMLILSWIFELPISSRMFIGWFIGGALIGGTIQLLGDLRIRKFSKNKAEKDFSVIQNRKIVLLVGSDVAFNLCKDSIADLKLKFITENKEDGFIKAKIKMNFHSFGTEIEFKLNQITDNLNEVEIQTRPLLKTTLVDYGESLRIIEDIMQYLKAKDAEINKKILVDSAAILDNVYVNPFQKGKIER